MLGGAVMGRGKCYQKTMPHGGREMVVGSLEMAAGILKAPA